MPETGKTLAWSSRPRRMLHQQLSVQNIPSPKNIPWENAASALKENMNAQYSS
jgi:hypothetical protein